jgi:hypothetical protein
MPSPSWDGKDPVAVSWDPLLNGSPVLPDRAGEYIELDAHALNIRALKGAVES